MRMDIKINSRPDTRVGCNAETTFNRDVSLDEALRVDSAYLEIPECATLEDDYSEDSRP